MSVPPPPQPASSDLEPSLLTARDLIAWRLGPRLRATSPFPRAVVITHQHSVFQALAPRFRRGRLHGLLGDVRLARGGGGRTGVASGFGVGAPAAAMLVEELVVLGVSQVIAVDVAAGIVPGPAAGALIVPSEAVVADGTSPHYSPGVATVAPDPALSERLWVALYAGGLTAVHGTVASTDAPFRETASLLESLRERGATAVDMETAALFATAAACGVAAAAVLVIGDTLLEAWQPPHDRRAIDDALVSAAGAALRCLAT